MSKPIHSVQAKRLRELLVEYRAKAELTQTELADKLGRAQTFVSKIEKGERRIDVTELVEMLTAMRADPMEFFERLLRRRR